MKIVYRTSMSGPAGATKPGDVAEVDKDEGQRLIDAGFADLFREEPEKEKAVRKPAPEKAVQG
ncbi:hypothetical protein [Mesorhizobium sp. IMUNJ 23232]|uniref:hypothetical protein n=1 Tax=Mesorhizobium sp. IMUNJ 23232 TaxID=3376064 RepID=UPI0037B98080